ncbi:MAG: DUF1800 family protein [Acidobacteriota bacterium]
MDRADAIHLLSRTSFYADADRVDQIAAMDEEEAIAELVDNAAAPEIEDITFRNVYQRSEYEDFGDMLAREMRRLLSPSSGLRDRLLWFWHGLLTSAFSKAELPALVWRQHRLIARHAMGNFRTLIEEFTIDPAILIYLDGNYSIAADPNENYSREVKELFTLGRGHYTEQDVKNGAKALAGWYVDGFPEREGQHFDPARIRAEFLEEWAFKGRLEYLGETIEFDGSREQYKKIINRILALEPKPGFFPAAEYIVTRLYQYFIHPVVDEASVARLAALFKAEQYEIKPLLKALFRNRNFFAARRSRARFPLETLLSTASSLSARLTDFDFETFFYETGQLPFDPPNVAGWPVTRPANQRWASASHTLSRARLGLVAYDLSPRNPVIRAIAQSRDPVLETLRRTSLVDVSEKTMLELRTAAQRIRERRFRARTLLALAIASPEFALA